MNELINGVMNGAFGDTNTFAVYFVRGFLVILAAGILFWFFRAIRLVNLFLKTAVEVLGGQFSSRLRFPPFYRKAEVKASYKGREVRIGVVYSGLRGEFLPLPHIKMRLKKTVGYNTNRLPNYAFIEKNFLVYKVRLSVLWGIFDKNYPQVFSKNHLVIALERLLSTAEDVERGRALRDYFK